MPIYEFQCQECGHVTSFLERYSNDAAHVCEKCGSKKTERLFSRFAAKSAQASQNGGSCPTGTCPLG